MCVEASETPGPISPGCDSLEDPPAASPSLFHGKVRPFLPRTGFGFVNPVCDPVPSVHCCSLRFISDEHSPGCSWQRSGSQQASGVVETALLEGRGLLSPAHLSQPAEKAPRLCWALLELVTGSGTQCWLLCPRVRAHWGKATLLAGLVLTSSSPPLPCQSCQNRACFSFCHFSIVRFHAGLGKKKKRLIIYHSNRVFLAEEKPIKVLLSIGTQVSL